MLQENGRCEMIAETKFEIVHNAVSRDNNLLSISKMCELAQVSRSGYYSWVKAEAYRKQREEADQTDFETILEAYRHRGYSKGARSIYMRLLHMNIRMNLKKIRRLMRKYELKCPHRGPNPYRQMAKALKTNTVFPNKVDRMFLAGGIRKTLLTDITYIFYDKGVCYLSVVIDAYTREVLSYELSESLEVSFVLKTVEELVRRHGCEVDDTTIVHSDQGCHYTSKAFIQALKDNGFVQSMSRKGNCWDNAPQESFFGHMKDEIRHEISMMKKYAEVKVKIDDWMDYYNNDRYQWDLLKLSPKEYYLYKTTGVYPLSKWGSAPNPEV